MEKETSVYKSAYSVRGNIFFSLNDPVNCSEWICKKVKKKLKGIGCFVKGIRYQIKIS